MKMVMEWVIALSLTAVRFGELMRVYNLLCYGVPGRKGGYWRALYPRRYFRCCYLSESVSEVCNLYLYGLWRTGAIT